MLETALPTALVAPPTMLPAELVTRDSPSCAFPAVSFTPSFAWLAREDTASLAASVLDEAARRCIAHLDCLSTIRGSIAADILKDAIETQVFLNGELMLPFVSLEIWQELSARAKIRCEARELHRN